MREALRCLRVVLDRGSWRRLKVAVLLSLTIAAAELVGLTLVVPLLDVAMTPEGEPLSLPGPLQGWLGDRDRGDLLILLTTGIVVAFVMKATLTLAIRWWMFGFITRAEAKTATRLLRTYLHAPYWFHIQRNTAELQRNVHNAVMETYQRTVSQSIIAMTEIATILAIATVLLAYEPLPTLVTIAYFSLVGWTFQRLLRVRTRRLGADYQQAQREAYVAAEQSLAGLREIVLAQAQSTFVARVQLAKTRVATSRRGMLFLGDAPRNLLEIALVIGIALLVFSTVSRDSPGESLSALGLFLAAGFRLLPSLSRLLGGVNKFRSGLADLKLIATELAETPQLAVADTAELSARPLEQALTVQDLSFRYANRADPTLSGIAFSIHKGQSVAIVGRSGGGKSTLINLLLGLHTPTTGSILIDGVPLSNCLRQWQAAVAIVPQDVYLLDASLSDNIVFSDAKADPAALAMAVQQARLDDLASDLPLGLETIVGERGMWLSGGQRQRVGIARALYRQPGILVLDEATSSLDARTEREITETIEGLYGDMTVLIAAHRLSTIRNCERILFLDSGHLAGDGTFDILRSRNQAFAEFVEAFSVKKDGRS